MGYRKEAFAPGHVYHLYNRGVEKRTICLDDNDRVRFRTLLRHCLPEGPVPSYSLVKGKERPSKTGRQLIDLLCYCLMQNHFHLLVRENTRGGISKFMQKLLNSYARYFNTRYKRTGPLFSGPFRSVLVTGDDQLLHVSRYIHLNPYVAKLTNDPLSYPWSSVAEYTNSPKYRFCQSKLLGEMMNKKQYRNFVTDYADYARELSDIKHLLLDSE